MYKPHLHDNPKHPFFTFDKFACPFSYEAEQALFYTFKNPNLKIIKQICQQHSETKHKPKKEIKKKNWSQNKNTNKN